MWPPSRHAAGTPSTSHALSRPRLVKHRRHAPHRPSTGGSNWISASGEASDQARATWSFSFVREGTGKADAFVFGSGRNEGSDGSADHNLPVEMRNLRIDERSTPGPSGGAASALPQEFRKLSVGEGEFAFRAGTPNTHATLFREDSAGPKAERDRVFVLGGKKNVENSTQGNLTSTGVKETERSVSGSYGESIASTTLPEDMRRLKIEGSRGSERKNGGSYVPVFGSGNNVGSYLERNVVESNAYGEKVASMLPEDTRNLNTEGSGGFKKEDAFVFGSGSNVGSSPEGNSANPSVYDENVASSLPEDVKRLNVQVSGGGSGFERKNGGGYVFVLGSGGNVGSSFEADVAKPNVYGENVASTLPEDMKKLNTASSGVDVGSKVDSEGVFVFGSGKNSDAADTLPTEIKKLNIGTTMRTWSMKDGKKGREGKIFVHGGSLKSSYATKCAAGNLDGTTELPKDMKKLNIGNPESEAGDGERCKDGGSFSGSFGENGVNILFRETKQNAENTMGNISAQMGKSFGRNEDINGNSTQSQFIFQAGSQDAFTGSNVKAPSTQNATDAPSMQNDAAKASSGPYFMAAASGSVTPGFVFTTTGQGREASHMDYTLPKYFSWAFRDSIFSGISHATTVDTDIGMSKNAKKHKRRNKLRQPSSRSLKRDDASLQREDSLPESFESGSPGSYSPMDFSPYENIALEQCSAKASLASDEPPPFDSQDSGGVAKESTHVDAIENLVFRTQSMAVNEFDMEDTKASGDAVKVQVETTCVHAGTSLSGEQIPGPDPGTNLSAPRETGLGDFKNSFVENPIGFSSFSDEKQTCDVGPGANFCFGADDIKKINFSFAAPASASASSQGPKSISKCLDHKKNRTKMAQDSYKSNPSFNFHLEPSSVNAFPLATNLGGKDALAQEGSNIAVSSVSQTGGEKGFETDKDPTVNQGSVPATSESDLILEACEKWRLRGNQAYANGNFSRAEEYYTCGMDCAPLEGSTSSHMRALMLCHSNRAATRMSLGRMREALADCYVAISIDPAFLKAHLRAANCHLALGETKDANRLFKKCLQLVDKDGKAFPPEASDGLQKTQQVEDYVRRSAELLKKRSTDDASDALLLISDALHLSPYSERLIELKANALFMLRRYEEVIKLSEQTFDSADKNAEVVSQEFSSDESENMLYEGINYSYQKIWRWNLIAKSYFYLGRLEEALNLLGKHKIVRLSLDKCLNNSLKSLASFSVTLQESVHQKAAGNNAFQANRHSEAVEHYSAAISYSTESRPFAAICFCNRAAAYQALGQVTDAIADCSLAIALDGCYAKAISRRATLHEMIRDYSQAVNDLSRLILLLERRIKDSSNEAKRSDKSDDANDLKRARVRLSTLEDEARKHIPLDLYMILGIEPSSSAADIKKAYRRAALRHHPDKACQLLTRTENSDDGLWKQLADEVHKDADRLFKMIGEAYAILSDRSKRLQYDTEEEMRNVAKSQSGSMTAKSARDFRSSYTDRSSCSSRQSFNTRRPSGRSQQWWSESSGASRHF